MKPKYRCRCGRKVSEKGIVCSPCFDKFWQVTHSLAVEQELDDFGSEDEEEEDEHE